MDEEESGEQLQLDVEVEKDEQVEVLEEQSATPSRRFDASRMIGIIRRKALIKELSAAYHAECLACCQQLLELQNNTEEPIYDFGTPVVEMRKERPRPPKKSKKTR